MIDNKIELLQKEVHGLIQDFSEKRKQYKFRRNIIQISSVCIGAMISMFIGFSFISEIELWCKVIGIILSAIATILNGISNIFNFEQRWRQRSVTYLRLLELNRDIKLETEIDDEKYEEYKKRLKDIMSQDTELWVANIEKQQNTLERKTNKNPEG